MMVIVIASDSDIGPRTSRRSRVDIGQFHGQTLANNYEEAYKKPSVESQPRTICAQP